MLLRKLCPTKSFFYSIYEPEAGDPDSFNHPDQAADSDSFYEIIRRIGKKSKELKGEDIVYVRIFMTDDLSHEEHVVSHGGSYPEDDGQYRACYSSCKSEYMTNVFKRDLKLPDSFIYETEILHVLSVYAEYKVKTADVSLEAVSEIAASDAIEKIEFLSADGAVIVPPITTPLYSFKDLKKDAWYYDYVIKAKSKGLMFGTSDTVFEPNATLTRAMLVTILIRFVEKQYGKELTVPEGYVRSFSDVKEDKWYTEQAYIAKANGIVTGYPDGTFRPNRKVTREEAVLMIGRVLFNTKLTGESAVYILNDAPEQPFKDADRITLGIDAERYTELLVRMGVLNGDGNGFFNPKADITRAETAKIIVKLTDVPMLNESNMADYAELSCDDEKPTWKAGTIQYLNVSVKFNTAFCYYGDVDRFTPVGHVGCKAMMSYITRPAIMFNLIEKGSLKTYMTYEIYNDAEVGVYDLTVEIPFASKVIEDCVTIIK